MKNKNHNKDEVIIKFKADLSKLSFGVKELELIGETDALILGLSCLINSLSNESKLDPNEILKMIKENIDDFNNN